MKLIKVSREPGMNAQAGITVDFEGGGIAPKGVRVLLTRAEAAHLVGALALIATDSTVIADRVIIHGSDANSAVAVS